MMTYTTFFENQRLSPDLQRQVDARRAQTKALEAARQQLLESQVCHFYIFFWHRCCRDLASCPSNQAGEIADATDSSKGLSRDAEKPIWADTPSHPSPSSRS